MSALYCPHGNDVTMFRCSICKDEEEREALKAENVELKEKIKQLRQEIEFLEGENASLREEYE